MTDPHDDYLDAAQIAAELDLHVQTVQRYFRTGSLPGRRVGKGWRTTRAALNEWLTGQPDTDAIETPTVPLEHKEHPL